MPVYGPSRGAYTDYHGSRRDCDSQPMLIRQELRSGALIAAERVELRPRVGSGSSRCGCAIPRGRPLRGTCTNQSCRVRERFGVVGPKRASVSSATPVPPNGARRPASFRLPDSDPCLGQASSVNLRAGPQGPAERRDPLVRPLPPGSPARLRPDMMTSDLIPGLASSRGNRRRGRETAPQAGGGDEAARPIGSRSASGGAMPAGRGGMP